MLIGNSDTIHIFPLKNCGEIHIIQNLLFKKCLYVCSMIHIFVTIIIVYLQNFFIVAYWNCTH